MHALYSSVPSWYSLLKTVFLHFFLNWVSNSKNINLSINYKKFGGIFDPASFGLYLDGFDKSIFFKNTSIDIEKFISKCAIDVKKYKIYFKKYNKKKVPYIFDANKRIKLLTLHIHSKRLNKFLSK